MKVRASRVRSSRRHGMGFGMALATSACVVLVISLISTIVFALYPGRGNASASFIPTQPGAVRWDPHSQLNVALLGTTSGRLTATCIIAFAPSTSTLNIVGVPVNLWADVPGFGQGTLSDAYRNGGPHLVQVVLEAVMEVPIRYEASTSLATFNSLQSEIGSPRTIAQVTDRRSNGTEVDPGAVAEDALLRRQTASLASTIRSALSPSQLFKIPAVVNMLGGSIPTNFPYSQVPDVAHALLAAPHLRVTYHYLTPANSTVSAYRGASGLVWLPDTHRIRSLIRPVIAPAHDLEQVQFQVLNGTGTAGVALAVSRQMARLGFKIARVGDAQPQVQDRTVVRVSRHLSSSGQDVALDAAAVLGAQVKPWTDSATRVPITIILGRDYQSVSP